MRLLAANRRFDICRGTYPMPPAINRHGLLLRLSMVDGLAAGHSSRRSTPQPPPGRTTFRH